jgi:hypothetical protein
MSKETPTTIANTLFLVLSIGFSLSSVIFWFEFKDWVLLTLPLIASALCLVVHKKIIGIKKEIAPYIIIESESGLTEDGERNLAEAHQAARSKLRT